MKDISELRTIKSYQGEISEVVDFLKKSGKTTDFSLIKKQINPETHDIMDISLRPDKSIKNERGETERIEYVARVILALQELIVSRAASFTFGNPVKMYSETTSESGDNLFDMVKKVLKSNKTDYFNIEMAESLFTWTEVAEYWFVVEGSEMHKRYGFDTKYKIRKALFSRENGDELYPLFDSYGDMVAFSRGYTGKNEEGASVSYLETWTNEQYTRFIKGDNGWELLEILPNKLGKIPIIYGSQKNTEWGKVQKNIDRLETLLSNFADTNDYHASPKIFIQGHIVGFAKKGESGAIIEGEKGSTAQYLSWQHAPESVKLEIETLFRLIYSLTQTPDISFESVKGLGEISGIALELLFLDAHLKVKKKMGTLGDYLTRRANLVKALVAYINSDAKAGYDDLIMEVEVVPFMINDWKRNVELYMTATGNKPIISQKEAVQQIGFVDDANADYEQIKKEESESNMFNIGEPTV